MMYDAVMRNEINVKVFNVARLKPCDNLYICC